MPDVSQVESFARPLDPPVRGFLHRPEAPNGNALVLTHGAGANADAPLLVALAAAFSANRFTVLRSNLPYRQSRPFGPPGPADARRDRAGLMHAVACVKEIVSAAVPAVSAGSGEFPASARDDSGRRIFLAGHSYGGRQASMLSAEEPALVAGLLLLSYPLHPPRRSEQQRTEHLPDLRTPTLFVHGTRDPFGTVPELERAIRMIPARTRLVEVEGAGHDLGFKGKGRKAELAPLIFSEFTEFFALSS